MLCSSYASYLFRKCGGDQTLGLQLNALVKLLESNKINRNLAKRVFSQMLETGKPATDFISEEDMAGFGASALTELCLQAIAENPKSVEDYRSGKEKAIKALLGSVMRASQGRANAIEAEAELIRIILG